MTTCPKCSRPVGLVRDHIGWHMDCYWCGQTAYGNSEDNLREVIERKRALYHPEIVPKPEINTQNDAEKPAKVQLKPPKSTKKERKIMPFEKKTEKNEPLKPEICEKSAKIEGKQPQKPALSPKEMQNRAAEIRKNIESAYQKPFERAVEEVYQADGRGGLERMAFGAGSQNPGDWARHQAKRFKKINKVAAFFTALDDLSLDEVDNQPEPIFQAIRALKRARREQGQ